MIIIVLTIFSAYGLSVTLSKFTNNATVNDVSRVTKWGVDLYVYGDGVSMDTPSSVSMTNLTSNSRGSLFIDITGKTEVAVGIAIEIGNTTLVLPYLQDGDGYTNFTNTQTVHFEDANGDYYIDDDGNYASVGFLEEDELSGKTRYSEQQVYGTFDVVDGNYYPLKFTIAEASGVLSPIALGDEKSPRISFSEKYMSRTELDSSLRLDWEWISDASSANGFSEDEINAVNTFMMRNVETQAGSDTLTFNVAVNIVQLDSLTGDSGLSELGTSPEELKQASIVLHAPVMPEPEISEVNETESLTNTSDGEDTPEYSDGRGDIINPDSGEESPSDGGGSSGSDDGGGTESSKGGGGAEVFDDGGGTERSDSGEGSGSDEGSGTESYNDGGGLNSPDDSGGTESSDSDDSSSGSDGGSDSSSFDSGGDSSGSDSGDSSSSSDSGGSDSSSPE